MLIRVCDNEKCKKQISTSEVKQIVLPHSNTTIDLCPTCYKAFMKEIDKFLKEGFIAKDKVIDLQIPEPKKVVEKNKNSIPSKKKETSPNPTKISVEKKIETFGGLRKAAELAFETNITSVASAIGIDRTTLGKKFKAAGIDIKTQVIPKSVPKIKKNGTDLD